MNQIFKEYLKFDESVCFFFLLKYFGNYENSY